MASHRDRGKLMTPMEEFIHYENLIIFKRRLADPNITDKQRRMLTALLTRAQASGSTDAWTALYTRAREAAQARRGEAGDV
jgi:hypothetical protein